MKTIETYETWFWDKKWHILRVETFCLFILAIHILRRDTFIWYGLIFTGFIWSNPLRHDFPQSVIILFLLLH